VTSLPSAQHSHLILVLRIASSQLFAYSERLLNNGIPRGVSSGGY
jgi:hypothetical protein